MFLGMEFRPDRPLSPAAPRSMPPGIRALLVGLPIAGIFALPFLGFAGWFLRALVHETGHTAAAWAFGCPAFPAIRLDGHAAAFHRDQVLVFALLAWALLAVSGWRLRHRPAGRFLLLPRAGLNPLLAFTDAKDAIHLLAGHLGELVFATIFFLRALRGGFVGHEAERPLYAALAWFWAGGTTLLAGGILFSAADRAAYLANRSFGIANDLERLSGLLGLPLGAVAFGLLLLSLAPLPLAFLMSARFRPSCGGRAGG